jgi:hypothetical protein
MGGSSGFEAWAERRVRLLVVGVSEIGMEEAEEVEGWAEV